MCGKVARATKSPVASDSGNAHPPEPGLPGSVGAPQKEIRAGLASEATLAILRSGQPLNREDNLGAAPAASPLDQGTATDLSGGRLEPPALLAPGDHIDRYEIREVLGSGGMGVVYRAHDPDLDRDVAIKLLRTPASGSSDSKDTASEQRLLREARAMAKLVHPNLVTVFDVGTSEGRVFVAMEYIAGQTLKQWIKSQDLPWRVRLDAVLAAGRGVAKAHSVDVVHRDLKPDNIMVSDEGVAMVADFGLARSAGDEDPVVDHARPRDPLLVQLTSTGALLGTPAYMSPEQFLGQSADSRSDQFSFAVVAYWALWGKRPFAGEEVDDLASAVMLGRVGSPPANSDVPAAILPVLSRALRTRAEDRFPSMNELLAALERAASSSRRRLWVGVAALAAVAVLVGVAGYLVSSRGQDSHDRPRQVAAGPRIIHLSDDDGPDPVALLEWLTFAETTWDGIGEVLGEDVQAAIKRRILLELSDSLRRDHEAEIALVESDIAEAVAIARELHGGEQAITLGRGPLPETAEYGELGPVIAMRVAAEHSKDVDGCIEAIAAKLESRERGVVLTMEIGEDGRVTTATTPLPGRFARELADCIARRATTWKFPRPQGRRTVKVTVPLKRGE